MTNGYGDMKIGGLDCKQFLECFLEAGWSEDRAEEMAKGIFEDRLRYERMSPDERAKSDKAKERTMEISREVHERHQKLWKCFEEVYG